MWILIHGNETVPIVGNPACDLDILAVSIFKSQCISNSHCCYYINLNEQYHKYYTFYNQSTLKMEPIMLSETQAVPSTTIYIIITMAQQPYMGSFLLFLRLLGRAHSWQLVTGQLAVLLFYRSWCDLQSHLAGSQETWVRNGLFEFCLRNISIYARKVLLQAVNLWHGTDGFTSPPKEVVLRIFTDRTREPWVQWRAR
jgi:hypothetical protein